jgi:hypothetical protein
MKVMMVNAEMVIVSGHTNKSQSFAGMVDIMISLPSPVNINKKYTSRPIMPLRLHPTTFLNDRLLDPQGVYLPVASQVVT